MRITRSTLIDLLVVTACFTASLCIGEVLWSFGVFFSSFETEFGWSRGIVSSGFTALAVAQGLSAIVAGRLADRYSPGLVLLGAALLAGPAIIACGTIATLTQFRLLLLATGMGAGALFSVPIATVQRHFQNSPHKAIALAITVCGIGIGALIFAPLLGQAILLVGWRKSFVLAGIIFVALVAPSALVIRTLAPLRRQTRGATHTNGKSLGAMVYTPQFAGVVIISVVGMFAFQVLTVHLVPCATDAGVSIAAAAAALGMVGGFSVPGRLVSGFIANRSSWAMTLIISSLGCGAGLAALPFVSSDWLLYSFVGFYGFWHGVRAVPVFGLLGQLFGITALGELTGILMACSNLFGALGPYLAGSIFDTTGTYTGVFIGVGVMEAATALVPRALRLGH